MKKSFIGILVFCLVCSFSFSVLAATNYTDVDAHWAEEAIARWSEEKVVNGYEDNTFKPDNYVTRAEYIAMIVRLFEPAKEADLSKYKDVDEDAWYYEAFAKAVEMGIVEGYDNDTLKPEANITRQEAMVILNRVLNLTASKDASGDKFTDTDKIANWAEEAVLAFIENGYLNGYTDGSIKPTGLITRAESAKILNKSIGMIIKEAGEYDLSEVEGTVIIKAEKVKITKAGEKVAGIITLNDKVKDSLKLDKEISEELTEDLAVINKEEKKEEDKKPSSGGGGGSSSSKPAAKVAKIVVTTSGDSYSVTRTGTVANGQKLTVVVDGTNVFENYVCAEDTFAAKMQSVIDALDATKGINALTADYNENAGIREWGMNTVLAIGVENPTAQLKAMEAAVLGNSDKVDVKVIYDTLIANGVSADTIKAKAIQVLPDTFTYAEGVAALNQI